jgi:MSHA pilin protein MshA
MIIVIIGILAAVAIPRFISLQSDAHQAAIKGMYGSVRSAASMIHATALARGVGAAGSVNIDGTTTVSIVNAYPAQAAGGIDNAIQFDPTDFTFAAGVFTKVGASAPATCIVTYQQPGALGNAPTITVTTSGC